MAIEERLSDLVTAHRVHIVGSDGGESELDVPQLPAIQEGEDWFAGEEEIQRYLVRLEKRLELWNRYQSDACCVDDEGEAC